MTCRVGWSVLLFCVVMAAGACSGKGSERPDPVSPEQVSGEVAPGEGAAASAPEEKRAVHQDDPEGTRPAEAKMVQGPFASLDAFAESVSGTILSREEDCEVTEGPWSARGGVVSFDGAARHVLLVGAPGALYRVSGPRDFPVDTELSTPEQYEGRAILRTASVPPGYVLIEHSVDFVDATQSGMAHDVLGYTHLCREHLGGMACASFTTKRGAYLIYDQELPDYEMPNAVIKDVEGRESLVELFYMNGGDGMSEQGFYRIILPQEQ